MNKFGLDEPAKQPPQTPHNVVYVNVHGDVPLTPPPPPSASQPRINAYAVGLDHPAYGRNDEILEGKWATGVFDCFDHCVPNGLMAWCCTCVTLAQVTTRLGLMKYGSALALFGFLAIINGLINGTPGWYCDYNATYIWYYPTLSFDGPVGNCSGMGVFYSLVYLAVWLVETCAVVYLRQHIRRRFKIPGDYVGDFFLSCCCSCCTAAQMATHVKSYRPGDCSFAGPDQLPAYQEY